MDELRRVKCKREVDGIIQDRPAVNETGAIRYESGFKDGLVRGHKLCELIAGNITLVDVLKIMDIDIEG